ncbi:Hypothetical protein PSEBR_m1204 [Pseudomonas brassicacearum subsp. brassicacearum NFM421]|uniref:Uncharacterized protein n=1 Tax=Pseudomonas brassicacearum (strain NFM421) TaxID=994484 RepID=F2KJJ1_PSEBN|nr:Hypothetical protein PSEBR_m1204 [Pseudomonas brassicacearum subsp. brassicacearum NFM421]
MAGARILTLPAGDKLDSARTCGTTSLPQVNRSIPGAGGRKHGINTLLAPTSHRPIPHAHDTAPNGNQRKDRVQPEFVGSTRWKES